MKLRDKEILKIALPSIAQNVTVPLLGLADAAISGHLGGAEYIGAVAVGSMVFNMLYWLCAFLRMSTGGLTAQAWGRLASGGSDGDSGIVQVLARALRIGLVIALMLLVLQRPLENVSFWLMGASAEVERLGRIYFRILIWGAPAVIMCYGLSGWFLGRQDARHPMAIAIAQNVINIVLSLFFVVVMGWKVEGVATGTLIAQWAAVAMYGMCRVRGFSEDGEVKGERLWRYIYRQLSVSPTVGGRVPHTGKAVCFLHWKRWGSLGNMWRASRLEGTLFMRTLCMVAVQVAFTRAGASQGDVTLAANALLLQFYMFFSYFMDGFASAGEAVGGKYVGAGDGGSFTDTVRRLFVWGACLTTGITLLYFIGGNAFLSVLTDEAEVSATAAEYMPYVLLLPVLGAAAFLFDGLYAGATSPVLMFLSVFAGAVAFFAVAEAGALYAGAGAANHYLWAAMLCFLAVRSVFLAFTFRRIVPG